jgi:predicted aspartyl protease
MLPAAVVLLLVGCTSLSQPVPFEERKGLVVVRVRVNGAPPAPFVLDTGASVSLIDERFARRLGVAPGAARAELTGIGPGNFRRASVAALAEIALGEVVQRNGRAVVHDLRAFDKLIGEPVAGVLGHSFLKDHRLIVDYRVRQVRLE